jgi:predicted transcriptional regulator
VFEKESDSYVSIDSLASHFDKSQTKALRNVAITKAIESGYKQNEIAKYLNLSPAGVSYILKNY